MSYLCTFNAMAIPATLRNELNQWHVQEESYVARKRQASLCSAPARKNDAPIEEDLEQEEEWFESQVEYIQDIARRICELFIFKETSLVLHANDTYNTSNFLHYFPHLYDFNHLRELCLEGHAFDTLNLPPLVSLEELRVPENKLTSVNIPTGLSRLRCIDVSGNRLRELRLVGLSALLCVHLDRNPLASLTLVRCNSRGTLHFSTDMHRSIGYEKTEIIHHQVDEEVVQCVCRVTMRSIHQVRA